MSDFSPNNTSTSPAGRWRSVAWLIALWAVFALTNAAWVLHDRQPPGCDQANHLMRSMEFAGAFKSASFAQFERYWLAEYGSVGQYTYPPLYHIITGVFILLVGHPPLAAALANSALLGLMMPSVYQLGRRAFLNK